MTSPVTTAASPAARPAAGADAGGADGAEPFATALDGALTAGGPAADGTAPDGGQGGSGDGEPAGEVVPATATDAVPASGSGIVAVLWARLTGSGAGEQPAAAGAPGRPAVTGVAHAGTRATPAGEARGLNGTQPGKQAGKPAPAGALPPAPGSAVPPAPAAPVPGAGPTSPSPAAVGDAAAALAAAGVQVVVAPAGGSPTAAPTSQVPAGSPPVAAEAPTPGAGGSSTAGGGGSTAAPVTSPPAGAPAGGDAGPDAAADGAPDQVPGVTGPTGAPATTATTATAPPPRADTAAAPAAQVAAQLARPVAVLRGGPDGTHTMTVVLTPETLGPVEISVTVSQGTVELTLRGTHDHGRAALIDALPELRRDLEAAGLTCSRVDVDRGNRDGASSSSSQQQTAGRDTGGGRQHERGDGARPWHRPADNGEGRPVRTRTASGLDVRV